MSQTMIINDIEYPIRNLIKFKVNGQTTVLPRRYIVDGLMKRLMLDIIDYKPTDELIVNVASYTINVKDACEQVSKCIDLKVKLPMHFVVLVRDVYYSFSTIIKNERFDFKTLYEQYRSEFRITKEEDNSFKYCLYYTVEELRRDNLQGYASLLTNVNSKWNSVRNTNIVFDEDGALSINEEHNNIIEEQVPRSSSMSKPPLPPTMNKLSAVPRISKRTTPVDKANRNSLPTVNIVHPLRPIATKRSMGQCPISMDLANDNINQYVTFFGKSYRPRNMQRLANGALIPIHALVDAIITYSTANLPLVINPCMKYNITFKATHNGKEYDLTNDYDFVLDQYRPKRQLPREYIDIVVRTFRVLSVNPEIEEDSLIDMILDTDRFISAYDNEDAAFCIKCTYHAYFEHCRVGLAKLIEHVNDDWNMHRDDVLKFDRNSNEYVVDVDNDVISMDAIAKILRHI